MNILGKHLILDVWLTAEITDSVVTQILESIRSKFYVVREISHDFVPYGLTHVCILSESHFTLHTYPEHKYLSMDLYICNESIDLTVVEKEILRDVPVESFRSQVLRRGRAID